MTPSPYTARYSPQQIEDYYRSGYWSTDTLHDLLTKHAERTPDKVFATDGTKCLTYRGLFDAAQWLAVGLHRKGWRAGDTATVQLPNWVEFIQVLTALARLGVVAIPIMPIYRREEIGHVLSNAGVRGAFTASTFKKFSHLDMYLDLRRDHPELEIVIARTDDIGDQIAEDDDAVFTIEGLEVEIDDAAAREELPAPPTADDPFVIVYTSGTTSRSKGCVHTFNTYCAGSRALITPFGYGASDVQFGPSPVGHTTGLVTSFLLPALSGASTHLMESWEPEDAIAQIQRFGCTAAVTAPTFLHTLLDAYDPERHDLSSMRMWTCAGAPIPAAVIERAGKILPNLRVLSLYGRSENLVTTTCSVKDDASRALTSDGLTIPGAEVRIIDDEGKEVPRGTQGDIAYRGPAHMIEYLGNAEETAKLFTADGFSRSGDLGTMTDDGYVRVTGRTKEIVIRGGMNISVREIEDHLASHPELKASACIGMPDERLGEKVCCYVVAADGRDTPTVEAIRKFLLSCGMPIQKTPERIVAVDELPMTATGKVLKTQLRKDIERRLHEEGAPSHEATETQ